MFHRVDKQFYESEVDNRLNRVMRTICSDFYKTPYILTLGTKTFET